MVTRETPPGTRSTVTAETPPRPPSSLVGSLRTLPDSAWEVVFGVLTAWFGYRVVRDARVNGVRALAGGHCAPHLVHSAAMLLLFLALAAPAPAPAGVPVLAGTQSGNGVFPGLPAGSGTDGGPPSPAAEREPAHQGPDAARTLLHSTR